MLVRRACLRLIVSKHPQIVCTSNCTFASKQYTEASGRLTSISHSRLYAASSPSEPSTSSSIGSLAAEVCSIRTSVLDVPGPLAEELCDLLLAEGATSAAVEEFRPPGSPEQKIFAHSGSDSRAQAGQKVWDRCQVVGYFPAEVRPCKDRNKRRV